MRQAQASHVYGEGDVGTAQTALDEASHLRILIHCPDVQPEQPDRGGYAERSAFMGSIIDAATIKRATNVRRPALPLRGATQGGLGELGGTRVTVAKGRHW